MRVDRRPGAARAFGSRALVRGVRRHAIRGRLDMQDPAHPPYWGETAAESVAAMCPVPQEQRRGMRRRGRARGWTGTRGRAVRACTFPAAVGGGGSRVSGWPCIVQGARTFSRPGSALDHGPFVTTNPGERYRALVGCRAEAPLLLARIRGRGAGGAWRVVERRTRRVPGRRRGGTQHARGKLSAASRTPAPSADEEE